MTKLTAWEMVFAGLGLAGGLLELQGFASSAGLFDDVMGAAAWQTSKNLGKHVGYADDLLRQSGKCGLYKRVCFVAGTPTLIEGDGGKVWYASAAGVFVVGLGALYAGDYVERQHRKKRKKQRAGGDEDSPIESFAFDPDDRYEFNEDSMDDHEFNEDVAVNWASQNATAENDVDSFLDELDSPVATVASALAVVEAAEAKVNSKAVTSQPSRQKNELASMAEKDTTIGPYRLAGRIGFALMTLLCLFCCWRGYQATGTKPIEDVRPVVDRMIVDAPQAALEADRTSSKSPELNDIGPETHRLVKIQAIDIWEDGTRDEINIESALPLEWLDEHQAYVGSQVPLPLDLVEMGLPPDLQGEVLDIQPCPKPKPGKGRLVLTTVNHLNRDVLELTLREVNGQEETLRPTGTHKFYSVTKNEWLSATELEIGEQLDGVSGIVTVTGLKRIPGTHRVYNMTVQGEHLYRVANCGVLVHNNGCWDPRAGRWRNTGTGRFESGYRYSQASLRHLLRRHSPHVGVPKQGPGAGAKGTLFSSRWSNRDIASAVREVANKPSNLARTQLDTHGNVTARVFEGIATRNGVTQRLRVFVDNVSPQIFGTGDGIITTAFRF